MHSQNMQALRIALTMTITHLVPWCRMDNHTDLPGGAFCTRNEIEMCLKGEVSMGFPNLLDSGDASAKAGLAALAKSPQPRR